jgi:uncharacterized protein
MINAGGSDDMHVTSIRSLELEADQVAKKIFVAANRSFNAPIDREDILAFAHDLDDAVDLIEDTAKGIQRYGVREFPAEMRAMADAVVQSAGVLQEVMPLLDAISQEHKAIFSLCERIGRIEGEADESFDTWPYRAADSTPGRRDRHDCLCRPQGALRTSGGSRRQVR